MLHILHSAPGTSGTEAWVMDTSEAIAMATDERIGPAYKGRGEFHPESRSYWYDFIGRKASEIANQADGAAAILREWAEGWDMIQAMRDELLDAIPPVTEGRVRRRSFREDDGDGIDLDRLRAGQPYWESRGSAAGPPIVTLVATVGGNCSRDAESLAWSAAAVLVACERLEASGYRCAVIYADNNNAAYPNATARASMRVLTVKGPQDPIDLAMLANLGSGWAYRTLWFRMYAGCPLATEGKARKIAEGLGHCLATVDLSHPAFPPGARAVPSMEGRTDAIQAARRMIEGAGR